MKNLYRFIVFALISLFLSSCGTLTGIPSHGGGKRFAIEQELVASTIRASIKEIDFSSLKSKKVAVYIVSMGDQGGGNIVGGKYSIDSILKGQHLITPKTEYPVISTTTTTGGVTTTSNNAINAPSRTKGGGYKADLGFSYNGLGVFRNEAVLNPRDATFLTGVINEYMLLKGVKLVPGEFADYDVYVMVDVFGTIRSRTDYLISNNESLIAKTSLEIMAVDRNSGEIVMHPQTASFESEYNEQFSFWIGPIKKTKKLRRSDGLLTDFTDVEQ